MRTTSRASIALMALALTSAGAAGIGAVSPAAAATPPPSGLSVTIDNGAKSTKPDSDVSYRLTLANVGPRPVTAWIVASMPAYGKITDAGGGQVKATTDTWKVTVKAGQRQDETVKVHIDDIPKDTSWVAAVASVYLSDDTSGAPVIRSADSDAIPGVQESAAPTPPTTGSSAAHATNGITVPMVIGIAGGIVIIAAALVALVVTRRNGQAGHRGRQLGEGPDSGATPRLRRSKEGQHSMDSTGRR